MIDELNENESFLLYQALKNERNKLLSKRNMLDPVEVAETDLIKKIKEINRIIKRVEQNKDLDNSDVHAAFIALKGLRDFQILCSKHTTDGFEAQRIKSTLFQIDRLIQKISHEYSF